MSLLDLPRHPLLDSLHADFERQMASIKPPVRFNQRMTSTQESDAFDAFKAATEAATTARLWADRRAIGRALCDLGDDVPVLLHEAIRTRDEPEIGRLLLRSLAYHLEDQVEREIQSDFYGDKP